MKRRLIIAAIFLLAGAAVNVAVAWGAVVVVWQGWFDIPSRLIFAGFIVNTLVYAVLLAVVWFAVRAGYRYLTRSRTRRGVCPACAYPMGDSAVCSECGRALPGRPKVVT